MLTYSRKKMKDNPNPNAFDFIDETSDFALRIMSKVGRPPANAVDKYTFLATTAAGKNVSAEEINYVPSLNIDVMNIKRMSTTVVEDPSATLMGNSNDGFKVADHPRESSPKLRSNLSKSEVNSPAGTEAYVAAMSALPRDDKSNLNIPVLLPSQSESDDVVEMDPDENESTCDRSSSSCNAAEEDVAGPSLDHYTGGWESDNEDTAKVVFYPEYVVYRNSYYTDPVISFTRDFIEMEASTEDGDDQTFKCKWGIEDIVHIRSRWHDQMEMAMIYVLTKDTIHIETVECTSGIKLKFPVIGSSWYEKLDTITSLNVEYKALWSNLLESEDTVDGHNGVSGSKYLPDFDRPFEEVVYPKGDADAVSLSKRDFDLLQPDTFVNDTIIDFYIKHLKNKIEPEERHRFHFFNSFFFRKLADPDKDQLDASQGRAAYQRVKKWTRKVNLFERDFVFIPVNYNYHWSLIVICHLSEVVAYKDVDSNESMKVPCVLHMDSFRGSHTGLKGVVQSYLREEWIERQKDASEDIISRFSNLKFISLELPQQPNLYDCGLFLLHYVELFLEQAPSQFNPFKITNSSGFLNVDWFHPTEACVKRVVIQNLICDLLKNPHQESSSVAGNEERAHLTTNVNKCTPVNVSQTCCNPSSVHCADDPTETSKLSFKSGSFLDTPFPAFNQLTTFDVYTSSLTPIEENVEEIGQFVDTQTESGIQQGDDIIPNDPYLAQDLQTRELWQAPVNNIKSSREPLASGCEDCIEIVDENIQLDLDFSLKNIVPDQRRSMVLDTLPEYVQIVDGNDDVDHTSSFSFPDMQINGCTGSENSLGLELDVQGPTKKIRMTEV
ncbi:probable ubiquitin-like-specific protease 2B isoform X2 [Rutidosis leptorrhynchoides]|uniref:probable ubiquitin-like-specific protease 2B isoform X2 n=1 Tax=Rutidosis leptorrhynchoides TaxID=125765 RepID=UPI003A98E412